MSTARISSEDGEKLLVLLLSNGADTQKQDWKGNTVLHQAASLGEHIAVDILIKYNADINMRNLQGATPIHLAFDELVYALPEAILHGKLYKVINSLLAADGVSRTRGTKEKEQRRRNRGEGTEEKEQRRRNKGMPQWQ
ncbi:uncharacterized protein PV07_07508 [Cladophialophora immunda]|uniref:Uncharacterized protein n=1 Tax=Cladophialophora immunda TaxID=569365 RepID=A0A0D1ZIK2_9EURO|nr:uncharacterized protein PV07_07508 [Cladophialophora immunda]KIW27801.1 hypothetical protein PV07_07508 [Cladophialophora immunda]